VRQICSEAFGAAASAVTRVGAFAGAGSVRNALSGVWLVWISFSTGLGFADDPTADYVTKVKPLLKSRCYSCHGALKQESGLRLDTVEWMLKGGESGAVIERDPRLASELIARVATADLSLRMPPEHEGEPLTAEQVELIKQWIAAGVSVIADEIPEADPAKHWSFQPIVRPTVPQTESTWVKSPVDAFIAARHRAHELTPQPEAPPLILLRRLYYDLLGVPPSEADIVAFENDEHPQRYERAVERLLEDPRHGERWARHWMDIWRYSDWWGLGDQLRNSQKHIWHWRDWIVESLNEDLPYDEMVRLMLAADETHPNDLSKLRATGYLARNYFLFNRPQWMEETVEHVSKGFLGLTVNCAKCHDHKFDPIEQEDFYRLRAFFEPYHVRLDMVPGEADLAIDGIPRAYDRLLDTPTYRYIRGDEKNPDSSVAIAPAVPRIVAYEELKIAPVTLPIEAWQPERRTWVTETLIAAAQKRLVSAEQDLVIVKQKSDAIECDIKVAEATVEVAKAERESLEQRSAAMVAESGAGSCAPEAIAAKRMAAVRAERWAIVAKARLAVALAEQKLQRASDDKKQAAEAELQKSKESLEKAAAESLAEVTAADDFAREVGAQWTPTRFFDSGKDDPAVAFPATSTGRRTALANWITDRRNPLAARVAANHIWARHMGQPLVSTVFDFGRKGSPPSHPELLDWLASELMDNGWSMKHLHRLIVNSAAYRMNSTLSDAGTNAAKDPENQYLWRRAPMRIESQAVRDSLLAHAGTLDVTMGGPSVPAASQATSMRRSLYFFHSNNDRSLFLTTFDEALVKDCYRREQSIVPQQALALSNSGLVLEAAGQIAKRLSIEDDAAFIRKAFRLLLGIAASDPEVKESELAIRAWRALPNATAEGARANFIWALINHNDFVTLR
jgi:Protein of unknown function (DUF1553)/Protein of unknown function (DUF1549)/Planctomycete cytochrome C